MESDCSFSWIDSSELPGKTLEIRNDGHKKQKTTYAFAFSYAWLSRFFTSLIEDVAAFVTSEMAFDKPHTMGSTVSIEADFPYSLNRNYVSKSQTRVEDISSSTFNTLHHLLHAFCPLIRRCPFFPRYCLPLSSIIPNTHHPLGLSLFQLNKVLII